MKTIAQKTTVLWAAAVIANIFAPVPAHAQGLNNNAWAPSPANRASIAALIRQVENGDGSGASASTVAGYAGGNVTQLICGSNSGEGPTTGANAQANSSCIILNNSDGTLNIDQVSDGEQSADASSTSTTNVDETINGNVGGADDVLAALEGQADE